MQDKIGTSPGQSSFVCVFQPKFQDGFEGNPERGALGIRMKTHFENHGLDTFHVCQVDLQKFAFWHHQCPLIILDLAQHKTMRPFLLMGLKMERELVLQHTPM